MYPQISRFWRSITSKLSVESQGFTLIELIIVVAILGVLAAAVVPNVARFTASATSPALCKVYVWEEGEKREVDQITIGDVQIYYPGKMGMGDSDRVLLRLVPSPEVMTATRTTTQPNDMPGIYIKISDKTDLYPIMFAELQAPNFEVDGNSDYREVSLESNTDWTWSIAPKVGGKQQLTIELSTQVQVRGYERMVTRAVFIQSFQISVKPRFDWGTFWQAIIAICVAIGLIVTLIKLRRRRMSRQRITKDTNSSNIDSQSE